MNNNTGVYQIGTHNIIRASYKTTKSVEEALQEVCAKCNITSAQDIVRGTNVSYVNVGDDEHIFAIVNEDSEEGQDYIADLN